MALGQHANSMTKGERHALLNRTHQIRTTAIEIAKKISKQKNFRIFISDNP